MITDVFEPSTGPGTVPLTPAALVLPFLETLTISGVALSVFSSTGQRSTVAASDEIVGRIDELQFELGEGPGFEVMESGTPWQIQPRDHGEGVNPFFLSAVREFEVETIITLPLTLGSASAGVATLYRQKLGLLSAAEMITASALVQWVTGPAIQRALISAGQESSGTDERESGLRREAHQATGMIIGQLDVSATEAFVRLRAYAFSTGQTVQVVSRRVITRELNFANLEQEK